MAVVIASRLCSAAGSGEVLVQDLVTLLVASTDAVSLDELKSYELKGVPERVRATNLEISRESTTRSGTFVARLAHNQHVGGSIPPSTVTPECECGQVGETSTVRLTSRWNRGHKRSAQCKSWAVIFAVN